MRVVLVILVGGVVGLAPAQQQPAAPAPAEVCRYIDARPLDVYDADLDVAAVPLRRAPARFADVLSRWWCEREVGARRRQVDATGSVLHAHGAPELVRITQQSLAQLRKEGSVVRARVQVSVLTVPAAVEVEVPKPGVAVAADEAVVTRLVRAAVAKGGILHNLPEVIAAPLRPFAIDDTPTGDAEPLRLRAELVPLGGDDALLGLHVVRGALPANLANAPDVTTVLASHVLRLACGGLTLIPLRERESITVLAVRCVQIGPAVTEAATKSSGTERR